MEGLERFRVAELTDDVVVLDRVTQVVYRIPGHLLDEVLSGRSMAGVEYLPTEAIPAMRAALSPGLLSRRRLIVAGSGVAAAGIVSAGLPFAAAASSPGFNRAVYSQTVDPRTSASSTLNGNGTTSSYWRVSMSGRPSTVQIGLGATNGLMSQDTNAGRGGGSGAYLIATVAGLGTTANDYLVFTARGGQSGGGANNGYQRGGVGGIGVGVAYVNTSTNTGTWILVAGGGGGDGGASTSGSPQLGGAHGMPGAGPAGRPGQAGTTSAGGAAGSNALDQTQPTAGTLVSSVSGLSPTLGLGGRGGDWETGRIGGGGGASGYAGGGGGGASDGLNASNAGGGAGGLTWVKSSGDGPSVTFSVVYTVPRDYSSNHSTALVEMYTSA